MRIILTTLVLTLVLMVLVHIKEREYLNEQAETKKLMKCAYNAGKEGAPVSVLEDNPCIVSIVKGRSAWDNYGSAK